MGHPSLWLWSDVGHPPYGWGTRAFWIGDDEGVYGWATRRMDKAPRMLYGSIPRHLFLLVEVIVPDMLSDRLRQRLNPNGTAVSFAHLVSPNDGTV
jgi:hypothetical protein